MDDEGEDFVEIPDDNEGVPMESDSDYEETEEEKMAQFEDIQENATMIFDRHNDSVFCSRTSPNGEMIASGGQDDRGFIFDRNGELYMALFGHKESVVSIDWNVDGSLLASGDMSGLVKIWDVQKKKSIIEFEEEEIECIKFHPTFKKYILVCQADGNSYFYSISDGNFKILVGSTGVRCISAEFLASGKEVIVLYQDSSLRIFDIKSTNMVSSLSLRTQLGEAICFDLTNDNKTILVGSSSGHISVVNCDSSFNLKVTETIDTDQSKETKNEDELVESHPIECIKIWKDGEKSQFNSLFAVASLSGFVYIYEKNRIRLKLLHPDRVNGVLFCPGVDVPRVLSSCLDGKLRIWDCRNGDLLITLHGHQDSILDLSITDMYVTSSSDDNTVRLWDLKELSENKA